MWPEISAGPSERAGFMEAPVNGPANKASSPMTLPTNSEAGIPGFCWVWVVRNTAVTNKKVSAVSIPNTTPTGPLGKVVPSVRLVGNHIRYKLLARSAPRHWAPM